MPSITVIVPVYKVEAYLGRCVDSILAQTFSDFELLLVDDGSPDNCPALCEDYARKDSRIHVIHQENQGLSAARNTGIDWALANSDTSFLSFIDSDDWIHPRFLETLYHGATSLNLPIASCRWQRIAAEADAIQPEDFTCRAILPEQDYSSRNNDYDVDSYAWRFLYHKSLFGDIRYPVGRHWEDLFTTYKLLFQAPASAHTEAVLYYYFIRSDSIARSPWRPYRLDMLDAMDENIRWFRQSRWPQMADRLLSCYRNTTPIQLKRLADSDLSDEDKAHYAKVMEQRLADALAEFEA